MRSYTCQDCGISGEHYARTGPVPARCAPCRNAKENARTRAWYRENREHVLAYMAERQRRIVPRTKTTTCRLCDDSFTYETKQGVGSREICDGCQSKADQLRKSRYRDAHRAELRAKGKTYSRQRYAADPEHAERQREYARSRPVEVKRAARQRSYWSDPEKHRERRRRSRVQARQEIYTRDDGRCHICGDHVPIAEFEIDHIVPVSRGGTSELSNLGTSHFRCNRRKSARLLTEMV